MAGEFLDELTNLKEKMLDLYCICRGPTPICELKEEFPKDYVAFMSEDGG